jgi:hypothetical protein
MDCLSPTAGGTIAAAQSGASPFNPAAFTSAAAASDHYGTLQYKWQSSTTSSTAGFSDIVSSNSEVYDATTQLYVSAGTGTFTSGQTIYQGSSQATATFIGEIVDYNPLSNVVRVINITGSPTLNDAVVQDASGSIGGAIRTLLSVTNPDFITFSGYMTYIENRTGVTRNADGTEQFRIVLRF